MLYPSYSLAADKLIGLRPKDNSELARNPWGFFEFWWQGPSETGPYTLEISKDKSFKDLIYFQTVNRIHDFTRHLPDEGTVYWRVKYKDQVTPIYKLNIVKPQDTTITIQEAKVIPFDVEKNQKGSIQLKWFEPTVVGPYDVEVSPDPDFTTLVFRKRVRKLEYTIDKFADAGKFFWRVRKGRIISPVGHFRINQAMVNAALAMSGPYIQLELPENAEQVDINDETILFRWQSLSYETSYRIEVSTSGDFDKIVHSQEVGDSQVKVPTFEKQGTYFWRVSSPRYESPVYSFVLTTPENILQRGLSLFREIIFGEKEKTYFLGMDYRRSSLKGHDLDGSTSGTLASSQFFLIQGGLNKKLFSTWDFELLADLAILERDPPSGFTIQKKVGTLLGVQAGINTEVLRNFRAGLFMRVSEFELAQTITGTFFEMEKVMAFSLGGQGEYCFWKYRGIKSYLGAKFYSNLPFGTLQNAFVSKFYVDFEMRLLGNADSRIGIFYEDIGAIKKDASQSTNAVGLQVLWDF